MVFRESFWVERIQCAGRVAHPNSTGTEAPACGTLLDLALCISSSGYSSVFFVVSSIIIYSKPITEVSFALSFISHSTKNI